MRKLIFRLSILILALVLPAGTAYTGDGDTKLAKSGSGRYRSARSAVVDVMQLGENRLQINYDETGVVVESPPYSPFTNASFHTMGTIHVIDQRLTYTGAALWTRSDGDQIFGVFSGEGALGVGTTKGFLELVGGTGRCSGIRGSLEFKSGPHLKSSLKGTSQGTTEGTIRWKIP